MGENPDFSYLLRSIGGGGLSFWCPGCKEAHTIWHGEGKGPRWTWNGNVDKPTFTPSVLVTHPAAPWEQHKVHHICHTFVTDGRIQFLSDCTHELAGQTVDMQPMPALRSKE